MADSAATESAATTADCEERQPDAVKTDRETDSSAPSAMETTKHVEMVETGEVMCNGDDNLPSENEPVHPDDDSDEEVQFANKSMKSGCDPHDAEKSDSDDTVVMGTVSECDVPAESDILDKENSKPVKPHKDATTLRNSMSAMNSSARNRDSTPPSRNRDTTPPTRKRDTTPPHNQALEVSTDSKHFTQSQCSPGSSLCSQRRAPRAKMTLSPTRGVPSGRGGGAVGAVRQVQAARKSMNRNQSAAIKSIPTSPRTVDHSAAGQANSTSFKAQPQLPTGTTKPVPKARKSFHVRSHSSNAGSPVKTVNLTPVANMTFKLPEIEHALGIKNKSLDKMDAKTLDDIVLRRMQKTRASSLPREDRELDANANLSGTVESNACTVISAPGDKAAPLLPAEEIMSSSLGGNKVSESEDKMVSTNCDESTSHVEAMPTSGDTALSPSLDNAANESQNFSTMIAGQKLLSKRKRRPKKRGRSWGRYSLPGERNRKKGDARKQKVKSAGTISEQSTLIKTVENNDTGSRTVEPKSLVESKDSISMHGDEPDGAEEGMYQSADEYHSLDELSQVSLETATSHASADMVHSDKKKRVRKAKRRLWAKGLVSKPPSSKGKLNTSKKGDHKGQMVQATISNMFKKQEKKSNKEEENKDDNQDKTSETVEKERNENRLRLRKRKIADSTDSTTDAKRQKIDSDGQLPALSRVDSPDPEIELRSRESTPSPPNISLQIGDEGFDCEMVAGHEKMVVEARQAMAETAPVSTHHHIEGSVLGRFINTPNGMTYPVTPPKTPESSNGNAASSNSEGGKGSGFPPLCSCRVNGASVATSSKVIYCQALDSLDGKIIGCCNRVTSLQYVRPAVKIPFMAICEMHRKRLHLHQCCPGCGHFCTQGRFFQCRKDGIHLFHRQCQVFRDSKYYCPHCGKESSQFEVTLKLHQPRTATFLAREERTNRPHARIGTSSRPARVPTPDAEESPSVSATVNNKLISSDKMPLGPSRSELESALTALEDEKPKKFRSGPKNLYVSCSNGEVERTLYLLGEGADPNMQFEDCNNQTALHAAVDGGHFSLVYLLIEAGASVHALDKDLRTPILIAAEKGYTQILQLLIKSGALITHKGEDSMTSIHLAAKNGHTDCVKQILNTQHADINIKDEGGWTPIIWAAEYRHVDTVKFLLAMGADPMLRDNEENTGLHWAAYSGSVDIAEIFLNAGCELDASNEHGDRPLHIAARQDHYECVVLFLARGADSEARNNLNQSPLACCPQPTSVVWMALRVNRQLKGLAAKRLQPPEQLLHRDISFGREQNPVPVVNGIDDENYPEDFLYVMDCVETSPMNVNRVITSLQHCQCKDDCSSMFCQCSRNSVRCWFEKDGKLTKDFNYTDPPLVFECNKACRCYASCQNRVVQLGITSRLQVFRTSGRGWGVRTLLDIPQGTFVCEYIGELICDAEADSREDDSYLFDLDNKDADTNCIDARRFGNVARFINHLCEPNLMPVKVFIDHQDLRFPKICFFANRDIRAYEELGFDYGEKFWIIKWKQFTCECTSPKCRFSKDVIQKTIEDYNRRQEEETVMEEVVS